MTRKMQVLFFGLSLLLLFAVACTGEMGPAGPLGPAGAPGPMGPVGPPGEDAIVSQEYVGSEKCGQCHEDEYARFMLSGHPYKLTKIEDGQPPRFPYDAITNGIRNPPEGYSWDDITYVIGGYGWKVRFIDDKGFIVTGDENSLTQYNYKNSFVDNLAEWVPYHPGEEKPYDCGVCHTTGYRPEGHQDDLEGIIGTWAFPGVQCEACHGPGSRHSDDPYGVFMKVDRSSQMCGKCHSRGNPAQIDAQNGFEKHHEQYEDIYNSKHFATPCVTCHDPHASTLFVDEALNPNKGIVQVCESCHFQNERRNVRNHLGMDCVDCHMAPMAKSAQGNLELLRGDIRSHQFAINTEPDATQFNEDGTLVMPYLTLEYACGSCHNGQKASVLETAVLAAAADGYHAKPTPTPEPTLEPKLTPTPEG